MTQPVPNRLDPLTDRRESDEKFGKLVEQITQRFEADGQLDEAALLHAHPEYAERLSHLLPTIRAMRAWVVADGNGDNVVSNSGSVETSKPADFGDFRILRELGRGGMGVVYLAEQISINRQVALKILPLAAVMDPRQLLRFRNEVQAVALLQHTNIVPIHSVGNERGIHYYAMQYVEGPTLAEVIAQLRQLEGIEDKKGDPTDEASKLSKINEALTRNFQQISRAPGAPSESKTVPTHRTSGRPLDVPLIDTVPLAALSTAASSGFKAERFRRIARLTIQAAEALDHAHSRGVLHRDVKPGNLMVDLTGHLWVTDFGLARLEADAGMTMTGDIVGTLRYMSPEQALAKRVVVDHRTDIYSLGATLFELLTLQPAFPAADRQELLKLIALEEPRSPRKLVPTIPRELETITLKAMEKDPTDRYATAQEMADDLRRYLEDRPVRAKPPTLLSRASKWSRRHVGIVWTGVAMSLLLSVVLATATALIADSRQAAVADRENAQGERNKAIAQRNEARLQQYYAEIVSGQTDLADGNLGRLQEKLVRHLPVRSEPDHRGWEWYYLFSHCHAEIQTLRSLSGLIFASWSPDGDLIATAGAIWRADSGECVRLFTPSVNLLKVVAWSPDSQTLAWGVSSDDDAIYLWDRQTDQIRDLRGANGSIWALSFSPDGKQLASGSSDDVRIWDWTAGTVVRSYAVDDFVTDVAWSPNGQLLAAGARYLLYVWEVSSGNQVVRRQEKDFSNRLRVSWKHDGSQLAVNTSSNWYILDCHDWSKVVEHPHPFRSNSVGDQNDVAWSPLGDRLAISHRSTVNIWDSTGENKITTLAGHVDPVNSVSWSPDGTRLVTTDVFREIRIWDLRSPAQPPPIDTGSPVVQIQWSSNADTLSSVATSDLTISSWRTKDVERIEKASPVINDGEDVGILSPDRRLRAHWSGSDERQSISVRNAQSGAVHSVWRADDSFHPLSFVWSPDGAKLAVMLWSTAEEGLEFWDVNKEQQISRWTLPKSRSRDQEFTVPTWSPDGAQVAVVGRGDLGDDGTAFWSSHVHVVDVATGKRTRKRMFGNRPRYGGQIEALAWSPDGHFLAQGTIEGLVEILAMNANETAVLCKAHNVPVRALAWSPNGQRLATAAADGTVKVIEPRQGNELLTLYVGGDGCALVSWSPDGKQLAAVNNGGVIRVWDATRGHEFAKGGNRRAELAWVYYEQAAMVGDESQAHYLRRALELAPKALDYRRLRGDSLARLGEFDEAAREFDAATPEQIEQGLLMARWRARALLGARDMDAYRGLQASLADAVQDSEVWSKWFVAAWLGALIPETTENFENYVKVLQNAMVEEERKLGEENVLQSELDDRTILILGAMQYRLGRHNDAHQTLAQLAAKLGESTDTAGQYNLACTQYFLALARHQLGHDFQARRRLVEADRIAQRLAGVSTNWHWQVEFATLHREATALFGDGDENE